MAEAPDDFTASGSGGRSPGAYLGADLADGPATRPGSRVASRMPASRDTVRSPALADPFAPAVGQSDGVARTLRYVWALVRRNWLPIVAILLAAIALAVVATMLETPRYTAQTSLQISDQSDDVLGDDLNSEMNVNTNWDVDRFLNTQIEILTSREMAARVARALDLYGDERFFAAMGSPPPEGDMPERLLDEIVLGMLRGNSAVDLPRDTRIVRLSFSSTDPQVSAEIANAYAEQFIEANLQRRYDSSAYARDFIAGQLQEARTRLEDSERELNAYARSAGLIRTRGVSADDETGGGSVTSASLTQLNQAANTARTERVAAEARWQAERAQPLLSSRTVLANPTVQTLMTRRSQFEADLARAQARYLDDHPEVTELRRQLASTESELNATARAVRDSVRADYAAADAAENRLREQVTSLQGATGRAGPGGALQHAGARGGHQSLDL